MEDFFTFDTKEIENDSSESEVERDDDDEDDDDDDDGDELVLNPLNIKKRQDESETKKRKDKKDDIDLEQFERDMGWRGKNKKKSQINKPLLDILKESAPIEDVLKKKVIRSGFERHKRVPKYDPSDKQLKLARKRQREKTKGSKWFNLPATEMTEEIKHDLEILQKRAALDPKHFYKKNDMKVLPKYFHIGKVVDNPLDYYSGRLTKKERKRTIVDELMADAQFAKYNKRKYKEIIDENKKLRYKAYKKSKKSKKRKKN